MQAGDYCFVITTHNQFQHAQGNTEGCFNGVITLDRETPRLEAIKRVINYAETKTGESVAAGKTPPIKEGSTTVIFLLLEPQ